MDPHVFLMIHNTCEKKIQPVLIVAKRQILLLSTTVKLKMERETLKISANAVNS